MAGDKTRDAAADFAQALALTKKIAALVDRTLQPLQHEMLIRKWPAEYQAILWEAVMQEAAARRDKLTRQ